MPAFFLAASLTPRHAIPRRGAGLAPFRSYRYVDLVDVTTGRAQAHYPMDAILGGAE